MRIKAADLLNRAAERIEQPDAWLQGRDAANAEGETVMLGDSDACAWCGTGAAWQEGFEAIPEGEDRQRRAIELYGRLREALMLKPASMGGLLELNDSDDATVEKVAAELRRRAELVGSAELAA